MSDQFPSARAAIFDLDGTLLDTLGDLADAVNAALRANAYPEHPEQAICRFIGDGAEMLIQRAMPQRAGEDSASRARCLESFQQIYGEGFARRTQPYAGIPELLAKLRTKQVPLGILSNKPHAFTLQCSDTFFGSIGELFQVVLGQREGIAQKPDPTGAIEVATALGISPGSCLYVGDSGIDMRTARAAGMVPIGVSWGFRSEDELHRAGAVVVIHTPAELLAAFPAD